MNKTRFSRFWRVSAFLPFLLASISAHTSRAESTLAEILESSTGPEAETEIDANLSPEEDERELEAAINPKASPEEQQEIEKEILAADAELLEGAPSSDAEKTGSRPHIPIEINERVQKWIHYFTVVDRTRFDRFLRRGSAYQSLVKDILKKNEVPTEIYYLAMIESGYVTHARSRARAVGPWQFMPGTGKLYGLQTNAHLDERQDIVRSTEAAARYLRGLHTAFQSWYLAMASYNAGEGRIVGAVVRGNSRNFWELAERKALPPETRNYVPKVLAALIIGRNPGKYGFKDIEEAPFPKYEGAPIPGGVHLKHVASKAGIPLKVLKRLNPHLIRGMPPPHLDTYTIWVPAGDAARVAEQQSTLAKLRVRARKPTRAVASGKYHLVRPGQSLSTIARRYGLSIAKLKRINGLRSSSIQAGKKLRIAGR